MCGGNCVAALHSVCVVGVSPDHRHTLALTADGSVYAFGKGLGLGLSRRGEGEEVRK
jgi:alpha-tubulin suppressor-like RCC1 family protein